MIKTIYWAAPCFTQAERFWNRCCAKCLTSYGYKVILPQDEAEKFVGNDGKIDFGALAKNCQEQAIKSDFMVAILDGPDPDSVMSMEVGLRTGSFGTNIIGIRTDIRVAEDGQLNRLVYEIIYFASFNESYFELCAVIAQKIKDIIGKTLAP